MIKVGVTGGIGSGKTTVCKLLEELDYPVYYADERAKWILINNQNCKKQVQNLFGDDSFLSDGSINRIYLADKVFKNEENVIKLNKIVHPLVELDFKNWLDEFSEHNIIFKEAALLFETGGNKKLDKIIVVDAPEQVRINRVLKRDRHRTEEQVKSIIAKQIPQETKNELADYLILNNQTNLKNLVNEILEEIKEY